MPINSFENYPMSWKPTLKKTEQKPLYLTLAEQLEQDIHNGILLPGTKLPPQRELADFLDINVSTVTRAFKICANKGLLSSTVGSGTYVSYDVNTSTLIIPEKTNSSIIELGSMMPETLPQKEATELLQQMLTEENCSNLFQYSYQEEFRYKDAAAQLLGKVGLSATDPQCILFANGGQNALAAAFAGLFQPGDRIGVDPLIYPGVKGAAKLFGIQLVPLRHEKGEISEEGLLSAWKNEGIKGLYVMPDLNNPTNHTMTENCRNMIAEKAKELDLVILEDSINSLLPEKPLPPIAALAPEHTVYLLSLSKTILPALRLAYLHVPKRYTETLNNALYHLNLSQSSLLLELASRLIISGRLENLLRTRRKGILERNRIFDEILKGYPAFGSKECLSRWLLLPEGMTGAEFERLAKEKGVSVYGSERFAVGKEVPSAAARIAICAPQTKEELEKGLLILKEILENK